MIRTIEVNKDSKEIRVKPSSFVEAWDMFFCVPQYSFKMLKTRAPLEISNADIIRIQESKETLTHIDFKSKVRTGQLHVRFKRGQLTEDLQGKIEKRPLFAGASEILRYFPISCLVWYLLIITTYLYLVGRFGPTNLTEIYSYNILSAQHALIFLMIIGGCFYPIFHFFVFKRFAVREKFFSTLKTECISLCTLSLILGFLAWDESTSLQEVMQALTHYLRAMFY